MDSLDANSVLDHRNPQTSIYITRDYFTFSSAHFTQLPNGTSEMLHGHNFTVRIEIASQVDDLGFVMDFTDIKSEMRDITAQLNQKTLLPGRSPRVTLDVVSDRVDVAVDGLCYSLPLAAVVILPVANTTCEALAAYVGNWLCGKIQSANLEVTVEECPGQGATWRCA